MRFVVQVNIRRQVMGLLLDCGEQIVLLAGTAEHEMVINVGIREKRGGVKVLG
jgi:hypothetical protein